MRIHSSPSAVVLRRYWTIALPLGLALSVLACSGAGDDSPASNDMAGASGSGVGSGGQIAGAGSSVGGNASAGVSGASVSGGGLGTGGASNTAGAAGGNAAGNANTAGSGNTAGGGKSPDSDTPPLRPLTIDKNLAKNKAFAFTAKQLDPMAGTSPQDTHAGDQESGVVNTQKTVQGKLVMTMGGIGGCCGQGGIGGYAVGLGFHHLAIAYQTKISSAPDEFKNVPEAIRTDEQNRQMGDGRMEAWDGKDRVSWLDINVHDSFAYRAQLAIAYMQVQDPGGDWQYFLNADGTVRWSDVYLVGYSYGSQTLAVVAKYVRIGRGIATSGPANEGFPNATWIKAPSKTPTERMYGLFGASNVEDKVVTSQTAGWLGQVQTVAANAAAGSFMMNHLFILEGEGHGEFCAGDGGKWKALCNYSFGVP